LEAVGVAIERLGLEAGPLSPWLSEGLQAAGLPAVCIETRRMKGATAAMAVKTDRNDAPAIAQAMRVGWFTAVHVKSVESLERRRAAVRSAGRSAPARTVRISFGGKLKWLLPCAQSKMMPWRCASTTSLRISCFSWPMMPCARP
jgi:transposase